MTIGYYVHHQGHGHLHRAQAFAAAWRSSGPEVVGLSTLPRPRAWDGPWVRLPRDVVTHRRHIAYAYLSGAAALVLVGGVAWFGGRPRRDPDEGSL